MPSLYELRQQGLQSNLQKAGITRVATEKPKTVDLRNIMSGSTTPEYTDYWSKSLQPSQYANNYAESLYSKYFSGQGIKVNAVDSDSALQSPLATQNLAVQKILSAPEKVTLDWLNQNFKGAQYLSPEVKQAFADNYRLGLASLYEPTNANYRLPWNAAEEDFQYRYGENNKGRYYSIQPKELAKIGFDAKTGFNLGNATISQDRDEFMDTLAPVLKPLLISGFAAGAGLGLNNLVSGIGQAAGTAGASTGGATGLSSLPTAGTWAQTATPALGAGAGSWTLPSALTGVSGATTAAGGLTLADALAAAPGSGTTTAAAGGLASSSSITDWLGNVFNKGVDKFMSDPLKNTLNLVSGISSYLGNNAQAKALEDYLKQGLSQSDPFGSQRAQYAQRLARTYTNPEEYLTSPEYKAISKRRLEALERADAAQGRRSQYGARTEKMHEFDLENLMKERTMLAQLAGSGISPSQVSSLMNGVGVGSAQAQANAPGNLLFMLNQIFGGK